MIGRRNEYGDDSGDRLLEHARCERLEWEVLLDSLYRKELAAKTDRASQILYLLACRVEDHLELLSERKCG